MLRLSRERLLLYGALLTAACLVQVRLVIGQNYGDWSAFWSAGATVGTPYLLDPARHAAWQQAHHVVPTIFPYLPATAWVLEPLRGVSLPLGYALNFVAMAIAAVVAALLGARVYALKRETAVVLACAFAPVTAGLSTGQNAPAGLLLSLCAVAGLQAGSPLVAGLSVGALLYKPLYALPFIALVLVRRNLRAAAVVLGCAFVWYLLSVAATAGDWAWPLHYVAAVRGYALPDARVNELKAISLPQLLLGAGFAPAVSYGTGALFFAAALPLLARTSLLEAASFAPLLALAAGPHTLPYDLTLALPALFYSVSRGREPLKTPLLCAVYLLAPLWLLSGILHFDVLALACMAATVGWLASAYGVTADIARVRTKSRYFPSE